MDIIKVNIYGQKDKVLPGGCCSSKKSSCNPCSSKEGCSGCKSGTSSNKCEQNASKNVIDLYNNLNSFLKTTDVTAQVEVSFIELNDKNINSDEKSRVLDVIERGFESPITVIDGIIRYCGGISNSLVYKDVKDLLS